MCFGGEVGFEIVETVELEFYLSVLKSPILSQKLEALDDFSKFLKRTDESLGPSSLKDHGQRFRYFNPARLKEFFSKINFLKLIFDENSHHEVMRRFSGIFQFLV